MGWKSAKPSSKEVSESVPQADVDGNMTVYVTNRERNIIWKVPMGKCSYIIGKG